MLQRLLVLFAVAGLLVFAFAGPSDPKAVPAGPGSRVLPRPGNAQVNTIPTAAPSSGAMSAPWPDGRPVPGSALRQAPGGPKFLGPPLDGVPAWETEEQVTSDPSGDHFTYHTFQHKIVVASNGVRHCVWDDGSHVGYNRYYPGSGWTHDTLFAGASYESRYPSIALDSDGTTIHVVFQATVDNIPHVYYMKCVPTSSGNGGWDQTYAELCQYHSSNTRNMYPAAACAPGKVGVVWEYVNNDIGTIALAFRECLSGTWQSQQNLEEDHNYKVEPSIAYARNGDVFLSYFGLMAGGSFNHPIVKRRLSGAWQTAEDAASSFLHNCDEFISIAVDPTTGYPHVVFSVPGSDGYHLIYHNWRSEGGWQSVLDTASGPSGTGSELTPNCFFTPAGMLEVVWRSYLSYTGHWGIKFNEWSGGHFVGAPIWIAYEAGDYIYSYEPNVTCGVNGDLYAVWFIPSAGHYQVWGRHRPTLPDDVSADSILRPVASYLTSNSRKIPPLARIKNYGSAAQGPFDVRLTINTPGSYSSTKNVSSLAAGATCTVEFDSLTLATGAFTAKCSTMLGGDLNPGNNARTACFQGCDFINFSDLTNGSLTADLEGHWALGVPQSPWTPPPMDARVWGDRLSGDYGDGENSALTSPTYKALQGDPAIAFQHNINTEASNDGGNFSYSANGSSWTRLSPSAGMDYNGVVSALGDTGWSGGPSGWNQSVFTIPVTSGSSFWVRWRFASDAQNVSRGWLLDEVAGIGCAATDAGGPPRPDTIVATLKVSPNPVRGAGQVSYMVLKDGNVSVKLYDITGALVARLANGNVKPGLHTAAMDASRLSGGVYFVKLVSEGDTKTTKVIIE